MSDYVLLLDVGGSAVKASAHGPQTAVVVTRGYPVHRPAPGRVEVDPQTLLAVALGAGAQAVSAAGAGCLAVVACTLRQGFVLLGGGGRELGPLVPNNDRRGAGHEIVLAGRYELTGHWPAAELTLPKLLTIADEQPELLAETAHLLFWHDWLLHRLGARPLCGVDYVCAGGMADVAARGWARDWLVELGIPGRWLGEVVEAGTRVGALSHGAAGALGLPAGTPLVAGGGDTQMAAAGSGGLAADTVTVVAGSSTPVQLAAAAATTGDPCQHPWVSTHLRADLWALEGNAGYPGAHWGGVQRMFGSAAPAEAEVDEVPPGADGLLALVAAPCWAAEVWRRRPPAGLVGLTPHTTAAQLVAAVEEAHGHGVRGNVEDLQRVVGRRLDVVVAGPARIAQRVADALGRPVRHAAAAGAAAAAWSLTTDEPLPSPGPERAPRPDRVDGVDAAYHRWLAALG